MRAEFRKTLLELVILWQLVSFGGKQICAQGIHQLAEFKSDPDSCDDKELVTGLLRTTTASALLAQCATWCTTNPNCTAFSYFSESSSDSKSYECRLGGGIVSASAKGSRLGSRIYYKPYQEGAPPVTSTAPPVTTQPTAQRLCDVGKEKLFPGFLNMTCVSQNCTCPLGTTPSPDNTFCSQVDKLGFHHYPDGFAYKRLNVTTVTSLTAAKAACMAELAILPMPYPDTRSLDALRRVMNPGDTFYLGIEAQGDYSMKIFVTNNGTQQIDAKISPLDPAQRWAQGQPNATSNSSGAAVVVSCDGWDDVPQTTRVNSVVCAKSSGYGFVNVTGKYYHKISPPSMLYLNYSGARALCRSEGGDLAITYGSKGREILKLFYNNKETAATMVAGTDEEVPHIWVFPDGMKLNDSNAATDPLQNWYRNSTYPILSFPTVSATSGHCLGFTRSNPMGLWANSNCSLIQNYLCERDW